MDLVDTNIWLERLLGQTRAEEVGDYLTATPSESLYITDFALHSIGLALARLGTTPAFVSFVQDTLVDGAVTVVRLPPERVVRQTEIMASLGLDYDDAYQYAVAEHLGLRIVSFDSDFDRTPLGRTAPSDALAGSSPDGE